MLRFSALFGVALACAAPLAAAETAAEVRAGPADNVSVTIYRDNLALITETRRVTLPGGRAKVLFEGVIDGALPQSAVIRGFEGAEAERNFDFDGLTPASLLRRSIGQDVTVVRTPKAKNARGRNAQPTEETARIAAAGEGISLQFRDRVEALGCAGMPEKLVFAKIPEGLRAKPTLSTTLAAAPAGERTITLSYLATGFSWEANYVISQGNGGANAGVTSYITLTNSGETGFENAELGVVAGDLARVLEMAPAALRNPAYRVCWPSKTTTDYPPSQYLTHRFRMPPPPPPPPPAPAMAMAKAMDEVMVSAGRAAPVRETLGDYQLYKMPERVSIGANQTKQVLFLEKPSAKLSRVHRFVLNAPYADDRPREPQNTEILLRFKNTEADGLGEPLPKGRARVMAAPRSGPSLYVGEDSTDDTAVGLDWELETGASSAVQTDYRIMQITETHLRDGRKRVSAQIVAEASNALSRPVTLELQQARVGDQLRISGETLRYTLKDGLPTWTIQLAPNSRKTLTYTVSVLQD